MKRLLKTLRWLGVGVVALLAAASAGLAGAAFFALPSDDGFHVAPGLSAAVDIDFDARHIPEINAKTRSDAFAALGYVSARDRLFQMDLTRRSAAGRLAETLGSLAVVADKHYRLMGLERVAALVFERVPADQRDALVAYSAGVNQAVRDMRALPVEFLALGYRPADWRPEDCVLLLLGLSVQRTNGSYQERIATVMRRALPANVVEFLTPNGDCYNQMLAPIDDSSCAPGAAAPFDDIAELLAAAQKKKTSGLYAPPGAPQGSNAWVVGGGKTRDGRAIMANDMHIGLSAPGIWYRAELHYDSVNLQGLTIPGVPLLVSGSNGAVAWGFTSVDGDFTDLVRIEPGSDPSAYKTPQGEKPFTTRVETINVRGGAPLPLEIRETIWGPVAPEKLLGDEVAIHWTALDPEATNFDLMEMDRIADARAALPLFHRAGGPPLNALVADAGGNIAWTLMGRFPKRFGGSGLYSESWADGRRGWAGYLSAAETPSVVNPASGFLVNTNNRMLGAAQFKPEIGHDYSGGFRAWRVTEWLKERSDLSEKDMLALQLDTTTAFYGYYQRLALKALEQRQNDAAHAALTRYIAAWDGRAEIDSLGLALIVEFRTQLIDAVISPIVARCVEADPSFRYGWSSADVPVMRIVDSDRADLLPDRDAYPEWTSFLVSLLEKSAKRLASANGVSSVEDINWGKVNTTKVFHPLFGGMPVIGRLFNMPVEPLPGCMECVRFSMSRSGASARMVVAPGHEAEGVLELPAGQSGQVGSPYYGDQEASWVAGLPVAFAAGTSAHRLTLVPPGDARAAQHP